MAVKLITPEHAQDPEFRERFKIESRIAASIEHPNVIPVYEAGEDDGLLFISMRFVDGVDLEQVLTNTGPLEPRRAARLIAQVAAALDAAHARGLVHRDVKPANVLLTDRRARARLPDRLRGLQARRCPQPPDERRAAGSARSTTSRPEQIRGEEVGPAADTYMLAGLLYHCLTGQPPFVRDSQAAALWAHMSAPVPAPSAARPELPKALDGVVARGLAKDPGDPLPLGGGAGRGLRGGRRPRAARPAPHGGAPARGRRDESPGRGLTRSCPTSLPRAVPARVRAC